VSEAALSSLVAGCPALRSLLAASCAGGVTDGLLRALAARLPGLESLCVSACAAGVTEGALLALAAGCKQLRYLDVSYNPLVTDAAVQAVAGACGQARWRAWYLQRAGNKPRMVPTQGRGTLTRASRAGRSWSGCTPTCATA
jgi:hypothetical protein